MIYIVLFLVFLALYNAWRFDKIAGAFSGAIDKFNDELVALKVPADRPDVSKLPDDWSNDRWGVELSKQEERRPLENPNPLSNPDEYTLARIFSELEAHRDPLDRLAFLKAIRRAGLWFSSDIVARLLQDESSNVRAWVAANLDTRFQDYKDFKTPVELATYEPQIQADPDRLVRASLWQNANCQQLPWSMMMAVSEGWGEQLRGMTQIERLALMRNPKLAYRYVIALLRADSGELGMSRREQAAMILAAAMSERVVWTSRHHGRDYWMVYGDVNPPFEEFGEMWEISLENWMDLPYVPYTILRFVQTTQRVKLATYQRLLKLPEEARPQDFRKVLIAGCDPFTDKDVLKLAWDDPDKNCREVATERVGNLTEWVGVSDKLA